jgi:hypothetical protein
MLIGDAYPSIAKLNSRVPSATSGGGLTAWADSTGRRPRPQIGGQATSEIRSNSAIDMKD